jgi:hypothetical protein
VFRDLRLMLLFALFVGMPEHLDGADEAVRHRFEMFCADADDPRSGGRVVRVNDFNLLTDPLVLAAALRIAARVVLADDPYTAASGLGRLERGADRSPRVQSFATKLAQPSLRSSKAAGIGRFPQLRRGVSRAAARDPAGREGHDRQRTQRRPDRRDRAPLPGSCQHLEPEGSRREASTGDGWRKPTVAERMDDRGSATLQQGPCQGAAADRGLPVPRLRRRGDRRGDAAGRPTRQYPPRPGSGIGLGTTAARQPRRRGGMRPRHRRDRRQAADIQRRPLRHPDGGRPHPEAADGALGTGGCRQGGARQERADVAATPPVG